MSPWPPVTYESRPWTSKYAGNPATPAAYRQTQPEYSAAVPASIGALEVMLSGPTITAVTDAAVNERVEYELIGGNKGAMTRGEIMMHVVTHHAYHRGFAADLFYQVPTRPPVMDLPVYFRDAPAEYR